MLFLFTSLSPIPIRPRSVSPPALAPVPRLAQELGSLEDALLGLLHRSAHLLAVLILLTKLTSFRAELESGRWTSPAMESGYSVVLHSTQGRHR